MAYLYIYKNDPMDPSYFDIQSLAEQIKPAMEQVNAEVENYVYQYPEDPEQPMAPVCIEFRNDMMSTTDYINIADTLFRNGRWQYEVKN